MDVQQVTRIPKYTFKFSVENDGKQFLSTIIAFFLLHIKQNLLFGIKIIVKTYSRSKKKKKENPLLIVIQIIVDK